MKGDNLFTAVIETVKHGLIYGIGQILSRAIGFLLIPLYTNYLSPTEFGVFSLLTITVSITLMLFSFGLTSALFRSYYDYNDEKSRAQVISTVFYMLLLSASVLSVIGYFASPYLSNIIFESIKYTKYFQFVFFTASLKIMEGLVFSVYRVRKLSKRYTIFSIIFFSLRLAVTILLVAVLKKGIWGVILADFLVSLVSAAILILSIKKYIIRYFSKSEPGKLLSFGLPLVPQNLSGFVLTSASSYFLNFFTTVAIVGIYNIGYKIGMIANVILVFPLAMIWNPMMLSIKDKDYCDEYYAKALTYFVFIGVFIISGLSLLSKDILYLISDESYWEAYKIIPLIASSYLFLGIARILDVGIPIKRKTHLSAIAFIAAAIFNLYLNWLLVPRLGMIGAAYATFLSYLLVAVSKYPLNRILYKIEYEWKRIGKCLMVGYLLYFVGIHIETGNIWLNIGLKGIIILIYPLLLIPLKFYEERERKRIHKIWEKYVINRFVSRI